MVIILMNVMRITTVSMCVCIDDFQLVFADTRLEFSEFRNPEWRTFFSQTVTISGGNVRKLYSID
jgi:hypothetical protein